jgi:hypothetical protein
MQGRNYVLGELGVGPHVVILQFCRAILTARSLGKKYVIQQNNLRNLLEMNYRQGMTPRTSYKQAQQNNRC